jgi:predicted ATPase
MILGKTPMSGLIMSSALALMLGAGAVAPTLPSARAEEKAAARNLSDKELRSFAKAYVDYHKIRSDYESRIQRTQDVKERERLQREGDGKVNQALQKQGLTPDSYSKIFATVNNNEQLRKKTLKYVEEERKKS